VGDAERQCRRRGHTRRQGYWAQTGYASAAGNTDLLKEGADGTSRLMEGADIAQLGPESSATKYPGECPVNRFCAIAEVVGRCTAVLQGAWVRLKWIGRILRSIAARTKASKSYPDRAIEILWNRLPEVVRSRKTTEAIGRLVHWRVRRVQPRCVGSYTRFFRNLPQLELLRDVALEMPGGVPLKIASLGCSTGAELYSVVWMIRTARPEQEIQALGIDISRTCIETAARGVYPLQATEVAGISETSYERLFTRQEDTLRVQHWLREGVTWRVGDACSSDLAATFGLQDIVLANNFLFKMSPKPAEVCLRNIVRLVAPNGYLIVGGIDLEVRSRTVRQLGLIPVTARLEEIYTAEENMLKAWPLSYWGLEPMDRRRQDWPARYTTVFRVLDGVRRGLLKLC
jgi:chemotaxis methyl-accepting protein methylase